LIDEQELAEQDLISFAEEQQRVCPSEEQQSPYTST
jgi:hypothetical protein